MLFSIIFIINIGIATYFDYYKYMNHHKKTFLNKIANTKQKIINHIKWEKLNKIEIKSRKYFYNDVRNLKNCEPKMLKIDKKSCKNIGI